MVTKHSIVDDFGTVDQVGIEERVAKFTTRSIKKASKLWGLKTAVSMVDLTTLEGKDTPGKVASLCQKARQPSDDATIPPVAAVCIYPSLVKEARKHLADSADQDRVGRDGVSVRPELAQDAPAGSEVRP